MGYSRDEQETVYVYDNLNKLWNIYSTVPKHIRKILDIADEIQIIECEDDRPIAVSGKVTEKQVSIKKKRTMTEEQKKEASIRMKKIMSENN